MSPLSSLPLRPSTVTALLAVSLAALLLLSAVFIADPGLDLAAARLFETSPGRFPAQDNGWLLALRWAGRTLHIPLIVACVAVLVGRMGGWTFGRLMSATQALFLLVTVSVGPGLIVNRMLKAYWGRPRPGDTDLFGGRWAFKQAWDWGGSCPANCSFTSGEASSSFWMFALVFVVPPRWRPAAILFATLWTLAISINRMAFGAHYLSDVVLSWCITALVILISARLLLCGDVAAREAALDDRLRRIGGGIARTLRIGA